MTKSVPIFQCHFQLVDAIISLLHVVLTCQFPHGNSLMILLNVIKNEILKSTKVAFRVIIIIFLTFFTFVSWFCQYIITVVMIRKFFCNQITLHFSVQDLIFELSEFFDHIFWSFCGVNSDSRCCVLLSRDIHGFFLTDVTNNFLNIPAPISWPKRYSKLEFRNNSPLS